jgi:hypothetical protein
MPGSLLMSCVPYIGRTTVTLMMARPPTEQEAARARMAYELLSCWHIVPGSAPDGTIDSAALNAWVDDVRARRLRPTRCTA